MQLSTDWEALLNSEQEQPYYMRLREKLDEMYMEQKVYPPKRHIYRALELTPYAEVKVVIIGQDPYHGPNQAHGLSFSVLPGVKNPPSLGNIFKELQDDLGCTVPSHGCLEHWAKQGVLLLNSVLTVEEGQPNSHRKLGWEKFTDKIIQVLNVREQPIAFVLWGRHAQEKGAAIDRTRHYVLQSAHPSPLSAYAGFLGSRPFSQCNAWLARKGLQEIDWQIPEIDAADLAEIDTSSLRETSS